MSAQMDKILLHFQDFDFSAYKRIDLVKLLKVLTGDSVTEQEIEQVLIAASVPQDGPVNFTKVLHYIFGEVPKEETEKKDQAKSEAPLIVVDMGNTIVDFNGEVERRLKERYPEIQPLSGVQPNSSSIRDSYNPDHRQIVQSIYNEKGFCLALPPIEGAVEALKEMLEKGYDVRICSAFLVQSPLSAAEKVQWIIQHFGKPWVERFLLTRNKSMLRGNIFINDDPPMQGTQTCGIRQVVFDRPYNRSGQFTNMPRLAAWKDWQAVIDPLLVEPLPQPNVSKVVLVDMDNTIAKFNERVYNTMASKYPEIQRFADEAQTSPSVVDHYPAEHKDKIKQIFNAPEFAGSLEPIEGAVDALREMVAAGVEVMICTAPLFNAPHCQAEKQEWVKQHLGPGWTDRLVITRDKTLVAGVVLVDDAPKVKGTAMKPTWEHILFDQPYNKFLEGRARIQFWSEWRTMLSRYIDLPPKEN